MRIHENITIELLQEVLEDDFNVGFCIHCGEEAAFGIEPDARNYECDYCNENGVFGAEELLFMV